MTALSLAATFCGSGAKSRAAAYFCPPVTAWVMNVFSCVSFGELRGTITYVNVEIGYAFLADRGGFTIDAQSSFLQ